MNHNITAIKSRRISYRHCCCLYSAEAEWGSVHVTEIVRHALAIQHVYVSSLSDIYHSIYDITYCLYVITLHLRTYTVRDSRVELLNLVLSFEVCLNDISIEGLNNFICLVHHI
jgi:hypothetical protein